MTTIHTEVGEDLLRKYEADPSAPFPQRYLVPKGEQPYAVFLRGETSARIVTANSRAGAARIAVRERFPDAETIVGRVDSVLEAERVCQEALAMGWKERSAAREADMAAGSLYGKTFLGVQIPYPQEGDTYNTGYRWAEAYDRANNTSGTWNTAGRILLKAIELAYEQTLNKWGFVHWCECDPSIYGAWPNTRAYE